ncbi:hypothetical protein [Legionella cincinnatiensis]|uniref:Hemoglobin (Protozoan/cyanobacterial globin family) n=1 Tax=Legionella cincinnatiensis TaxID=28085 RepID=A0ABR5QX86_9GAMM|nr:hypothetical protein [Legionella cincinnatiensis]KTC93601.1 hemoglobin (protozoan/cyanobacterial globin family) [Legionella cincinnatiensis]
MPASLYECLGGGQDTVTTSAVNIFYRKILADQRIKHFFDGLDMGQQIIKKKGYLLRSFGVFPKSVARSVARNLCIKNFLSITLAGLGRDGRI